MKVEAKTIAPCQHRLSVSLPPETVAGAYDDVYRDIGREAVIPGFRKGKAPRDLLQQHHAQAAREEVLKRLIGDGLDRAARERKLRLTGECRIADVQLDERAGLRFTAEVEVEPEVPLGAYKGLALRRPSAEVGDGDVAQALAALQEHRAELAPTGAGEEKTKQVPVLDDAFAKDVGFPTLEALRQRLRHDLETQRRTESRQVVEQHLYDALLLQSQFDVPPSLVAHQVERLRRNVAMRLLVNGVAEEQVKQEIAKLDQDLATNAQRQVKIRFILDRIAEAERLSVTREELVGQLWTIAQRSRQDPGALRKRLDAQGGWEALAAEVRYEKTMDFLLREAKIEDAPAAVASSGAAATPAA